MARDVRTEYLHGWARAYPEFCELGVPLMPKSLAGPEPVDEVRPLTLRHILQLSGDIRRLVGRTVQAGSVPGQHFPERAGFSAVPQPLCTEDRKERQPDARPATVACFCVGRLSLDRWVSSDDY